MKKVSLRVGNQVNQFKLLKRGPEVILPRVVGQGEQEAQTQIEEEVVQEIKEQVEEELVEEVEEEVVVEGDWWKKMTPNKE